jgi:hypothetical protein
MLGIESGSRQPATMLGICQLKPTAAGPALQLEKD